MKIIIYRHSGGYCFIPRTIEAGKVPRREPPLAVICGETSTEELVATGLGITADLIVTRMYLHLPFDLAEELLHRLKKADHRESAREMSTAVLQ